MTVSLISPKAKETLTAWVNEFKDIKESQAPLFLRQLSQDHPKDAKLPQMHGLQDQQRP